jgi:hypothetical protein
VPSTRRERVISRGERLRRRPKVITNQRVEYGLLYIALGYQYWVFLDAFTFPYAPMPFKYSSPQKTFLNGVLVNIIKGRVGQ